MDFIQIENESRQVLEELIKKAKVKVGDSLVVGCSTSEVAGENIGTSSSADIAEAILAGIMPVINKNQLRLAAQCCEHLNRALIVESEFAQKLGLEIVNVIPKLKAGGAFATSCWKMFNNPVALETIKVNFGIDIGGTLIGMHIKPTVVPVKLTIGKVGKARVICARSRPKFIGGKRAEYNEDLM